MKKNFIQATVTKTNGKLVFVASDETMDRYGDSLDIDMWDLKNFKKSPRLFVDHNPSVEKIVGIAKKIWVDGKKLMFEPQFHNITELARTVEAMVIEGVLDTVSVGFIMHEDRYELLEISFVGLPANPNARLQKALEFKANEDEVELIEKFVHSKDEIDNVSLQEILGVLKGLQVKTSDIERHLKASNIHPLTKKQVIKARSVAKLTVKDLSAINTGLKNLIK